MRETLYAVVRHQGQWGIRVRGNAFFACEDFRAALDVAMTAAALLAQRDDERKAMGRLIDDPAARDDARDS